MANILVLHGVNLNLLGTREPQYYGDLSLEQVDQRLQQSAQRWKHQLSSFQSNSEADLIDKIHQALSSVTDFIIINPAAFAHTSIALRDALLGVAIPFIEVHI